MIEIGKVRAWNNENGRLFIITKSATKKGFYKWQYLDAQSTWEDREEYILGYSVEIPPVLQELYES